MSHITISKLAVEKICDHPECSRWRKGKSDKTPVLSYYRRCYSTLHDGTISEHGDGFVLSFVDPGDLKDTRRGPYERIALADGLDLLVGQTSIQAGTFTIGWANGTFTFEPRASS